MRVRLGEEDLGGSWAWPSFLLCPCARRCRKEPRGTLGQALEPVDSMFLVTEGCPGEVVRGKALPQVSAAWSRGGDAGQESPAARGPGPLGRGWGAGRWGSVQLMGGGLALGWADGASKREF